MYLQVKKDTKYFNEKSINQLPVRMPRLKGGGGEKCFSPNQILGTRVGDRLGKGKYFPFSSTVFQHSWASLFLKVTSVKR